MAKQRQHIIERGNIAGEGPTLAKAKADLDARIDEAISAVYVPEVIQSRGIAFLLWRDLHGWNYSRLTDKKDGWTADEGQWTACRSFQSAFETVVMMVAQESWNGEELFPPILDRPAAERMTRHKLVKGEYIPHVIVSWKSEFAAWRAFQLAYKAAPAGIDDQARWQWAQDNLARFAA